MLPALGALVLLMLLANGLVTAQDAKTTAATAKNTKDLTIQTEHYNTKQIGKDTYRSTLTDAQVRQEDATFSAKNIIIDSVKNVHTFTCTGNPVFTDTETRITSTKVVGQSSPRQAEFTGNVKMVTTPKKKEASGDLGDQLLGEPTTVTCNSLSYDYGKKLGHARGSVVVQQKNRTLWADSGLYDQGARLITMSGNIRMQNQGEEAVKSMKNADKLTVSLQEDWVDIVAKQGERVEFQLEVDDTAD